MFRRLQHIIPSFKKRTWWILSGYTLSLFGTGMTEPYLILYLHQLRGIPLSLSGMVIGISGLAGVTAVPISGMLSDLFGEKRIFLAALIVDAVGRICFAGAFNEEWAFLAAVLSGAAAAGSWNALSVILADSVENAQRGSIFGVAFALQNLGSGLGAALSGILLQSHSIAPFQLVFVLDAVTFILFALFSYRWIVNSPKKISVSPHKKDISHFSNHALTENDKILIGLALGYSLIAMVMTGLTTTLFPQWVTEQARVSVYVIGEAFLANSLVIIIGQLIILRVIKNIRRTRAIAAAALIFALGYSIIFVSGLLQSVLASFGLICSLAVTAVAETILFSSLPALVNDLAPRQARGRYNSVINAAWQAGSIFGPVITGIGLTMHLAVLLFLTFIFILIFLALLFYQL